jgi:hypothetical protein
MSSKIRDKMSLIWMGVDLAKAQAMRGTARGAQLTPSRRELASKRLLQKRFRPPWGPSLGIGPEEVINLDM